MATTTHILLSEYLETSYRPDCEYVDGEIRERNVGKWEHARVQLLLAAWFYQHEQEWGITGSTEQRIRVSPNRVRVPDLAFMPAGPQPDVLVDPSLLIIEILSPDDSYSDTQERAQDYRTMGVETVWIIDPKTRNGRMCSGVR
jgi:Uma2 family endonuclease